MKGRKGGRKGGGGRKVTHHSTQPAYNSTQHAHSQTCREHLLFSLKCTKRTGAIMSNSINGLQGSVTFQPYHQTSWEQHPTYITMYVFRAATLSQTETYITLSSVSQVTASYNILTLILPCT